MLLSLGEQAVDTLINASWSYPHLLKRETTLTINADGFGQCSTQETIVHHDADLSVIPFVIMGDSPAKYEALAVKADSKTDGFKVASLKVKDEPTRKSLLLVLDPPLPKGCELTHAVSWGWPKLWEKLSEGKPDYWREPLNSAKVVPVIRTEFRVSGQLPVLTIENFGKGGGHGESLEKRSGYNTYVWTIRDISPGQDADAELWLIPEKEKRG
jgi:hypothetical protein